MIELQHVWFERQGRTILQDVGFEVDKGEFVYLGGPTGAGKTTLLRLILFEDRPTRGVVFVGDYDSESIRESDLPYFRRRVAMVFQELRLLRERSVYENVALAAEVTGAGRTEVKQRTLAQLSEVSLLHKRSEFPDSLSAGERQRVAIARALVNDPHVLLADESSANLDPEATEQMMDLFAGVNARGTAVVMATHDVELIRNHPRRTLTFSAGRVESADPWESP